MDEYARFYEESLYPLQDGVLRILAREFAPNYENAPFLTGGTALSRCYFEHRYSDDLDLFFVEQPDYSASVEHLMGELIASGLDLERGSTVRTEAFSRFVVTRGGVRLMVDFVNDTAPRFGELVEWERYPRVDSLRNMLANKLTALPRLEAKDVVDLREIALRHSFDWSAAMRDAEAKEAGLDAPSLSELIRTFPSELLSSIKWKRAPDSGRFSEDLHVMARDLVEVRPNSLSIHAP